MNFIVTMAFCFIYLWALFMRKLLFIIILLPAVISLGHDVYFYMQNPNKGFQLSDVGALWDKYHKDSHDQWKSKLHDIEETVGELNIIKSESDNVKNELEVNNQAPYLKGFSQEDGEEVVNIVKNSNIGNENKIEDSALQKVFGFILEQKAVFVFGGFAAVVFILNWIFSLMFREKTSMDKLEEIKRSKKSGKYKYGRK